MCFHSSRWRNFLFDFFGQKKGNDWAKSWWKIIDVSTPTNDSVSAPPQLFHLYNLSKTFCVLTTLWLSYLRVAWLWKCRSLQQDEMMPLRPGDRILLGTAPDDATRLGARYEGFFFLLRCEKDLANHGKSLVFGNIWYCTLFGQETNIWYPHGYLLYFWY